MVQTAEAEIVLPEASACLTRPVWPWRGSWPAIRSTRKSYAYICGRSWLVRAAVWRSWRSAVPHRALRPDAGRERSGPATISRRLSTLTGFYRSLSSTEPSRPPR